MSSRLQQEAGPNVLRILLEASELQSEGSEVIFELTRRGETEFRFSAPAREIGLGGRSEFTAQRFRYGDADFRLPQKLERELAKYRWWRRELWLELDAASSRLSFVPWEDLLAPYVPGLVLRLPRHSLFGDLPAQHTADLVVCASEPLAKSPIPIDQILPQIVLAILNAARSSTTIHIFTDQKNYDPLTRELRSLMSDELLYGVRVYDPSDAKYDPAEFSDVVEDDAERLDNPWLNWMADTLPRTAIGAVHFLCHGYFSAEQGALAFAESPSRNRDPGWARFVGARQINTFLDRIGASAVAFTSPDDNYSVLGLRLLVSQLASLRPAATFMHGLDRRPGRPIGYDAYNFYSLLSGAARFALPFGPPSFIDLTRHACFYCPPSLIYPNLVEPPREVIDELPETTRVIYALSRLAESGGTGSGWMTSGSNVIKRAALDLVGTELFSERQRATHEGAKRALEFVSDVLSRHAGLGDDDRPRNVEVG